MHLRNWDLDAATAARAIVHEDMGWWACIARNAGTCVAGFGAGKLPGHAVVPLGTCNNALA